MKLSSCVAIDLILMIVLLHLFLTGFPKELDVLIPPPLEVCYYYTSLVFVALYCMLLLL
jgi:hypothetical protein